jgi:hypothetical protein
MKIIMKKTMKKMLNKVLIASFLGILFAFPVLAEEMVGFHVEFEADPLFSNANLLPGDSVSRWVKVYNYTGETISVATEAINWDGFPNSSDIPEYDLSRALEISIKKGENTLHGPVSLFDFYKIGETYFDDIPDNSTVEYDFEVSFPEEKGNYWQEKTTYFDILVGRQGEGGASSGGGIIRGLIIKEPLEVTIVGETTAVIEWETSYASTSSVIYDDEPGQFNLAEGEPKYGYEWIEEGDDSGNSKVISHKVTIEGLNPGTTYYYRCISHGSLALSKEYSFTTLGEGDLEYSAENSLETKQTPSGSTGDQFAGDYVSISSNSGNSVAVGNQEESEELEEEENSEDAEKESNKNNSYLASLLDWFKNQNSLWILILIPIAIIFLLFLFKKKKQESQNL